jgi:hypothetical protein
MWHRLVESLTYNLVLDLNRRSNSPISLFYMAVVSRFVPSRIDARILPGRGENYCQVEFSVTIKYFVRVEKKERKKKVSIVKNSIMDS